MILTGLNMGGERVPSFDRSIEELIDEVVAITGKSSLSKSVALIALMAQVSAAALLVFTGG